MTFEEFKNNVQGWAKDRGIYEHSTPAAQALKAVSEVGEVADAVIKGDRGALKDGIGDVMVCLVNLAFMAGVMDYYPAQDGSPWTSSKEVIAASAATEVALCAAESADSTHINEFMLRHMIECSIRSLYFLALSADLDFMACCEHAWNEIKDRKGRMVPGGAFVKEEGQ